MYKFKRSLALLLTLCMVLAMVPTSVFAVGHQHGDQVVTNTETPPAAVEGGVWVLTGKVECSKIVHTHEENCFYQTCDHKDGHLSTCYSSATAYALCEHEDEAMHTGSVDLTDVVTINGTNVTWKKDHPAYSAVYAVYKAAYDEAYASAKYLKDTVAKAAGVAALVGKTFCYTTNASATPDQCTHGECSDFTGACYTKICILDEHTHTEDCFQYTWTLKADLNKNGVADDVDQYYVVKYVVDGEVVYEEAVLVNMPTPTVQNPVKDADAQYTYTFAGWDEPVAEKVTQDVVYTAVFTNATNKYTVTWVDENGKVLETDKDVEYGKMPVFDGETPTKKGDNTVVYTFAGWTPTVETVTGDVTYTATYTTHDVFEVKFFIDGELQKTEYVVDGEKAEEYQPTRKQYQLSPWMNGDVMYDFDTVVTGAVELHASWKLVEAVVTVKAPNAAYTWNGSGVYNIGEEVVIKVIPKEGYAVSKVLVNGESVSLSYDDGIATVKFKPDATTEKYLVDVKTTLVKMTLNAAEMNVFGELDSAAIFNAVYSAKDSYPELNAADVKVEYLAYSIELLGKTYEWWVEPGTEVSLTKFLSQYGLGSLASYIPAESVPHEFGAQSTERVRVSFEGNDKYCAVSAETTVAMIDLRTPTKVELNTKVEVTYGATAEEILALVFKGVYADETVVADKTADVTITMDSLNAGTRKATVAFAGNNDYAPSVAEVEVTINKAAGKLEIDSYTGKYGTDVNVSDMFTSNGNRFEIVMGLNVGANASADAGTVIMVNMPALIDLSTIEDATVRALAEKVMNAVNDKLSGTMTVAELKSALEEALPYVEMVEGAGYEININANTLNMLISVLNQMSELEGVGDVYLQVTIDKDIVLKDAGAYLIAGVVADSNYTTAVNGSYVVITPDGYRAELGWNVEDENGIITLEALRKGYDMGASATSVAEGNIDDANAHVYTVFFGVNKAGEMVLTQDKNELDIGAYAQVAFILDAGNTMYYAEPITRTFLVAADIVKVQFVDQNGKENNDRVFAYGEDATMHAVALDRTTGEVEENGTMSYLYLGLQANGEMYNSNVAPTRPGVYTVIAMFIGSDEMNVGAAVGALVIEPINPEFYAEDNTVQYDGNEHKVLIYDKTGMNRIFVIVDENGNMNVVVPNILHTGTLAAGATVNELLTQLKGMKPANMPEIPEELTSYYSDLESTVKDAVEQMKKQYNVKSVSLNAPFPSEIGVYQFTVIGFKDAEHKLATSKATLTIDCEHEYANACDSDCDICGETREVELHKETYVSIYESTCVKQGYKKTFCKACNELLAEETLPLSEEHAYHNNVCLLCGAKEFCEHDYVVVKELEPTCKDAGYVWTECSICGAEKNYEVGEPTGEHGETYIDRMDSSCVKHGYEKTRCKVCDEVLSEVELPLSEEHPYYKGQCLLCGKYEQCQHNYETVKELAPSCGEAGYRWTKCSECGAEKNYEFGEPTGEHTYDNACDAECNGCTQKREVADHVYKNACDADCDICGATRTPAEHKYQNNCDADCDVCGETRTPADHVYDHDCDATCNECGEARQVKDHVYDNACDKDCNVCEAEREVPEHAYTSKVTKEPTCGEDGTKAYTCSECGHSYDEAMKATGAHEYDNLCDTDCNVCGETRDVSGHEYTSEETKAPTCGEPGETKYTCSKCGHSYTEAVHATGEHTYKNDCDADCDVCGAERTPAEHVYDDMYDADCNVCGAKRDVPEKPAEPCKHEYDNDCDDTCNKCEAKREVTDHVYDNDCDADCNVCAATREVGEHVYDNACDADCNACGATREAAAHVYDHDCDTTCNTCGATRETEGHAYDDEYDATCNICGEERDVAERPTQPGGETPPQTGDSSNMWLWIVMMIGSAAAIFFILLGRKKSGKYAE